MWEVSQSFMCRWQNTYLVADTHIWHIQADVMILSGDNLPVDLSIVVRGATACSVDEQIGKNVL